MKASQGNQPVDDPVAKRLESAGAARRPSGLARIGVVLGIVVLVIVPLIATLTAVAIYGVRRYLYQAKAAEGRAAIAAIAQGIARCSTPRGSVPESSPPVPVHLSMVSGQKYQSAPEDWSHQAFRCAGFWMQDPQYFQYQWLRESDSGGMVRAEADLDGDGTAEVRLELDVVCGASGCKAAEAARETLP